MPHHVKPEDLRMLVKYIHLHQLSHSCWNHWSNLNQLRGCFMQRDPGTCAAVCFSVILKEQKRHILWYFHSVHHITSHDCLDILRFHVWVFGQVFQKFILWNGDVRAGVGRRSWLIFWLTIFQSSVVSPPKLLDRIQPDLVCSFLTWVGCARAHLFLARPPGEGSRGQITIQFNYKDNFKNFYATFCTYTQ